MSTNAPWLDGTAPVPVPAEQVFYENVANVPSISAPVQGNSATFFDNAPNVVGSNGAPPNSLPPIFTPLNGFAGRADASTPGVGSVGAGNSGGLAQGQYNPTSLG